METREPNSITYWESRKINIGDYEGIDFGATAISKFIPINRTERKAEITDGESTNVYPEMTEEQAFEQAQSKVRKLLDAREKEIRLASNTNGNTSFDTLKKATDFKIVGDDDIVLTDTDVKPPKAAANEELDTELEDFDDEPAKPVVTKKTAVKKPVTPPKAGFVKKTSTTGLFAAGSKTTTLREPIPEVPDWEKGPDGDIPI
jgi:hypothetical protein